MGVHELLENKFVRDFLRRVGGERAIQVVRLVLKHNNAATDEEIADDMKVKVTVVRAALNRLHYWGIADYTKTRDEETGWYTYRWHILPDKFAEAILKDIDEEIQKIDEKLEELERFMLFECKEHVRVPFEVAAEYQFRCPYCGKPLEPVNQEEEKKALRAKKEELERLKKTLSQQQSA